MAKFGIDIVTKADLGGAKQAEDALRRVDKTAGEATGNLGKGAEKAAKKTESLRSQVSALGSALPALGRIGSIALTPLTLAIGAAIAAFQGLRMAVGSLNDIIKNSELADEIFKISRASDEAAPSVERVANAQGKLAESTNAAVKAMRAQANAQAEVRDAREALELAQIDAAGGLTEADKIGARMGVRNKYARQRISDAEALEQAELEARRKRVAELEKLAPLLSQQAQTQAKAVAQMETELGKAESTDKRSQAVIDQANPELAKILGTGAGGGKLGFWESIAAAFSGSRPGAWAPSDKAPGMEDALFGGDLVSAYRIQADDLSTRRGVATGQQARARQRARALRGALPGARAQASATAAAASQVSGLLGSEGAGLADAQMGASLGGARRTAAGLGMQAEAVQAASEINRQHEALLKELTATIESGKQLPQEMINRLANLHQWQQELSRRVSNLETRSRGQLNP